MHIVLDYLIIKHGENHEIGKNVEKSEKKCYNEDMNGGDSLQIAEGNIFHYTTEVFL